MCLSLRFVGWGCGLLALLRYASVIESNSSNNYTREGNIGGVLAQHNSDAGMQNLSGAGALVSSFGYLYGDSNGGTKHRDSIVQMTRQVSVGAPEVISYGYDEVNGLDQNTLDQLTRETVTRYGARVSETLYAYDASGNRTQRTYSDGGGSYTSTFSYDTLGLNQLMSVRTSGAFSFLSTFAYDLDGNMTQEDDSGGGRKSYYWDSRGGLVFEQRGTTGGQVNSEVAFFRDALGRLSGTRISGLQNGQWTVFPEQGRDRAFVGSQVLAEHDGYGTYISHSVRALSEGGIGGLLMTSSATPGTQNHQFPHYDAQGNLNGITNGGPYATGSGGPFLSRTYDAYGNVTGQGEGGGQGVPARKWGYSTKEEVAPGLLHYGERMYRPDIGRWISRDPIGEAGGMNLYGFVGNNPVNFVDPYGLDWLDNASNFSAGWGDSLTFGATKWGRRGVGSLTGVGDANAVVDYCSGAYTGGQVVGTVHQAVLFHKPGGRPVGLSIKPVGGAGAASEGVASASRLLSRVKSTPGLLRSARGISPQASSEINGLLRLFKAGQTNPGLGNKSLTNGIFYLRGRNGGRVFLRQMPGGHEILGYADKSNESAVIALLQKTYGR